MVLALWDIPNHTHVKVTDGDAGDLKGQVFFFVRPDGMYSYCEDRDGNIVHLRIDIEVQPVKGFE